MASSVGGGDRAGLSTRSSESRRLSRAPRRAGLREQSSKATGCVPVLPCCENVDPTSSANTGEAAGSFPWVGVGVGVGVRAAAAYCPQGHSCGGRGGRGAQQLASPGRERARRSREPRCDSGPRGPPCSREGCVLPTWPQSDCGARGLGATSPALSRRHTASRRAGGDGTSRTDWRRGRQSQ